MADIITITGGYIVDLGEGIPIRMHRVLKDKSCSCGEDRCRGIQAVYEYLRGGGEPAPEARRTPSWGRPTFRRRWEPLEFWQKVALGRKTVIDYFRDLSRLSRQEVLEKYGLPFGLEHELCARRLVKADIATEH